MRRYEIQGNTQFFRILVGIIFARVLQRLGVKRALVVHGEEGLDEISPETETCVWEVRDDHITTWKMSPESFGLKPVPVDIVRGGDAFENARAFMDILEGRRAMSDPLVGFIAMNVSALLYVSGRCKDLKEGTQKALEAIKSGKAKQHLETFQKLVQSFP